MHPTSSTILPPFSARGGRKGANLRTTLEGLLGWVEWQWSILDGATQLDGGWLEDFFTYLIVGIKEEPGLGGDPFLQGLIAYNKIIAQEKVTFPPHVLSASLIRLQQYVPFLGRFNLQLSCSLCLGTVLSYRLPFSRTPPMPTSCSRLPSVLGSTLQTRSSILRVCSWQ